MPLKEHRKCFFLSLTLTTCSLFGYMLYTSQISVLRRLYHAEDRIKVGNFSHYLIQTKVCNILDFDQSHPSIAKYTYKTVAKLVCSKKQPLTEESGQSLIFYEERIPDYGSSKRFINCSYQGIVRVNQRPDKYNIACDSKYRLKKSKPIVKNKTEIAEDGILVTCSDSNSQRSIYRNVHYFLRPSRAKKKREKFKAEVGERSLRPEKLSVIIMGTDSVSRGSLRRHMPKTFDYLTNHLHAIDLKGHNKIGDNTYPNVVALLMGLSVKELKKHKCQKGKARTKFDDCPLIWKDFSQKGYVTAYAEDSTHVGSFQFEMAGFVVEPTDYYNRPYFRASERFIGHNAGLKGSVATQCQGGTASISVIHNYSLAIAEELKDIPYFGYYWTSSMTHHGLQGSVRADEPCLEYLTKLQKGGYLDHTILFFISDHGLRGGKFRETYPGMLEERLPFAFIVFPFWFKEQYPEAVKNMRINTNRLTSTFDLHATLFDISNRAYTNLDKSSVVSKHGQSIFQEIPLTRECKDAGIPEHYCACEYTEEANPKDPHLLEAAKETINSLNLGLEAFPNCSKLSLDKVLSGRVGTPRKSTKPKGLNTVITSYIVSFITEPGEGAMEATVKLQEEKYRLSSEVSRINKYGNQSHCITDRIYRKYCYCNDLLS